MSRVFKFELYVVGQHCAHVYLVIMCYTVGTKTIVVNVIVVVEEALVVTWSKYYHCAVSVVVVEACSA